jgi:hypothetical protein
MKITTNEGEFELIAVSDDANFTKVYGLKPVKKTEKKEYQVCLDLVDEYDKSRSMVKWSKDLHLTPTTANKLSEAISALVEYVTTGKGSTDKLTIVATEALQEYWESQ